MTLRWIVFGFLALATNTAVGYAAFRRRSVSGSGALAGAAVGTVILTAGGFLYWIMLMLFFVSSSLASHVGSGRKDALEHMHEKGSRRDYAQVLANGGVAAVLVLLLQFTGNPALGIAAAAALASANADTWASEFGVLSARRPRSIVTWRPLERGTSGGVSLLGTGAAAAGSLVIATWYAVAHLVPASLSVFVPTPDPSGLGLAPGTLFLIVLMAGLVGTTVDSLLGATLQAQYRTPAGATSERREIDGVHNVRSRGLCAMNNDLVNLLSGATAAAFAVVVAFAAV